MDDQWGKKVELELYRYRPQVENPPGLFYHVVHEEEAGEVIHTVHEWCVAVKHETGMNEEENCYCWPNSEKSAPYKVDEIYICILFELFIEDESNKEARNDKEHIDAHLAIKLREYPQSVLI
jgi:hypothetical protein